MFNTIFCCFSLLEIFSDFSEWSGRNVVWWSTSEEHRAIIVVSLRYFWGRGPAKYLCLYRESRAITVSALSSCFVPNQLDCNSGLRWRQRRQFPEKPSYFITLTGCDCTVFVKQTTRLYRFDWLHIGLHVTYLNFSDLAEGSEMVARKTEISMLTFILSLSLNIFRL